MSYKFLYSGGNHMIDNSDIHKSCCSKPDKDEVVDWCTLDDIKCHKSRTCSDYHEMKHCGYMSEKEVCANCGAVRR